MDEYERLAYAGAMAPVLETRPSAIQSAAVVSVGGEAGVLWAAGSGSARTFQPA